MLRTKMRGGCGHPPLLDCSSHVTARQKDRSNDRSFCYNTHSLQVRNQLTVERNPSNPVIDATDDSKYNNVHNEAEVTVMFHMNLKTIRLQQGLSQKQVADYLSVSAQSISKWEKGEALPSIEYLPKLATFLNCDINAFFKPIQMDETEFCLLCCLLEISYEYIYTHKEIDEKFNDFFIEHPNALDTLKDFENIMKQHQIIKPQTLTSVFNCSEEQASVFMDYFVKHGFAEKLENNGSYFVLRDNIGSLRIILNTMLEVCKHKYSSKNVKSCP